MKIRILIAALAVALVTVTPAGGAPPVPNPTGPGDGAEVVFLPAFSWDRVTGADKYQFQLAADANFNSPLFNITTRNTRATPEKTVPNGTYYWRVASVDSAGSVSNWSPVMSVVKLWADRPELSTPAHGDEITYPTEPLVLRWTATPGAAKYRVFLARDEALGSLVTSDGKPWEVQATSLAANVLLASNTYYWAVTPLDAQGNPGDQSPVRSFTWTWPSTTTPMLTDLAPSTEHFDPQFSWDRIAGAARYEVEVNSDDEFDPASRVCCEDDPISTTLTPLEVFFNNTYYWRVRAIDRAGNAGVWNEGEPFVKRFDNYPDLSEEPLKNLRLRDEGDPGTDDNPDTPGYQTDTPILAWDPVPGAASYQVDVVPFEVVNVGDPQCNWTAGGLRRWTNSTAATAWTPLGNANTALPFSTGHSVSKDIRSLTPGESYCVRVRARSGRVNLFNPIWGDYTFIGNGSSEPSFTFTDFPTGQPCSGCYAGYLGTDDYMLPVRGSTTGMNPLFTWKPIVGKNSYWVIVAKDPSFTTIVDYAITRIPAYAVRTGSQPHTYDDEETSFYWVVLPASGIDGSGAPGNPAFGAYADFLKQTTPPTLLGPADGAAFAGQPTFQWTSVFGARRYRVQVDNETTFSTPVDDQRTASTAFTSLKTYQSATTYYWRVAPEDENTRGLTWSETRSFQIALPKPVMSEADFGTGEAPPVISWSSVEGAVSYTLDVQEPDGDHNQFSGFPSTASSWQKMTGVGIMTLKVRAEFPTSSTFSTISGPWSEPSIFTHTIREPTTPTSDVGQDRLLLSWDAKTGMKNYKVQISAREDFSPYIENKTTDNPRFAPTLISSTYTPGGHFWWRVAAVDADGNTGDWATRTFDLPPLSSSTAPPTSLNTFRLSSTGSLVKGRYKTVYIYVKDASTLAPVRYASVRASGAGVTTTTKLSNSTGVARFYLKATRYPGTVTFRVSRSGYATKYLYKKVRLP